jgi:hypothetical protein
MKQRGGRIVATPIPDAKLDTIRTVVSNTVAKGSTVSTDEFGSYALLKMGGYYHGSVNHGAKEWARSNPEGDVLHHTNSVESFWKLFKHSVRSTHIHVSSKYMDTLESLLFGQTTARWRTRCLIC